MEKDETKTLWTMSIAELKARHQIANRIAREARTAKDERCHEAERQARAINEVLVARIQQERQRVGLSEPEPVRIGLRPLDITAERLK